MRVLTINEKIFDLSFVNVNKCGKNKTSSKYYFYILFYLYPDTFYVVLFDFETNFR